MIRILMKYSTFTNYKLTSNRGGYLQQPLWLSALNWITGASTGELADVDVDAGGEATAAAGGGEAHNDQSCHTR